MRNLIKVATNLDTVPLRIALATQPELWNQRTERTTFKDTSHAAVSDIWIRYNPDATDLIKAMEPHYPVWYPAAEKLPQIKDIAFNLMNMFKATHLGGILITKLPAGGHILPHNDEASWHARFYNMKFYVAVQDNVSTFRCEDEVISPQTGDVWYINNLVEHEVENRGDQDRITLIICMCTK